ncbi:hypothetical protein DFP72DRAFT_536881 [Ephemerocybe angulata]|uniref:Uncharacterized protein n=1 Tax=Ephemerocybe angulata TaxID=980116 RepID=A0A8H6HMI5_9AGAR|nr:hypothetical protein DFP72DRAFT_536881 [Tulosesus angulatus]
MSNNGWSRLSLTQRKKLPSESQDQPTASLTPKLVETPAKPDVLLPEIRSSSSCRVSEPRRQSQDLEHKGAPVYNERLGSSVVEAISERDMTISRLVKLLERRDAEVEARDAQIASMSQRLEGALAEKDRTILELTRCLEESARQVERMEAECRGRLEEQEGTLASLEARVVEKDAIITDMQAKQLAAKVASRIERYPAHAGGIGFPSQRPLQKWPSRRPIYSGTSSTHIQPHLGARLSGIATSSEEFDALKTQYELRIADLADRLAECHAQLVAIVA